MDIDNIIRAFGFICLIVLAVAIILAILYGWALLLVWFFRAAFGIHTTWPVCFVGWLIVIAIAGAFRRGDK